MNKTIYMAVAIFFMLLSCSKTDQLSSEKTKKGHYIKVGDINVSFSQEVFGGEPKTRSFLNNCTIYSDGVAMDNFLCANISITTENGYLLTSNLDTKVSGDPLINSIEDGKYRILAYDYREGYKGNLLDWVDFEILNGNVTEISGGLGEVGKLTHWSKVFVCVKIVDGVTIDATGDIIFDVEVGGANAKDFFVSEVCVNNNFETNKTLSFVMRRQVSCIRLQYSAIDPDLQGDFSLFSVGNTLPKKLIYSIKGKNVNNGSKPEDIIKKMPSENYGVGEAIKSVSDLLTSGDYTEESATNKYPYKLYKDFYVLGDASVLISQLKVIFSDAKDSKKKDGTSFEWWKGDKIFDLSLPENDDKFLDGAGGFSKIDKKIKPNHRYTINCELTVATDKIYEFGEEPSVPDIPKMIPNTTSYPRNYQYWTTSTTSSCPSSSLARRYFGQNEKDGTPAAYWDSGKLDKVIETIPYHVNKSSSTSSIWLRYGNYAIHGGDVTTITDPTVDVGQLQGELTLNVKRAGVWLLKSQYHGSGSRN